MTTHNKYTENTKLYRMLESMERDIKGIGVVVRGMNETVSELLARTECIYDAVSQQPESRIAGMTDDSFLDELE